MTYLNLISLIGLLILPLIAWVLSTNRRVINWRVTVWGIGLQLAFAAFIFALPAGRKIFLIVNDLVVKVVEVAGEGGKFVFGPLANPPGREGSLGFILATQALPTIIFFAALLGLLYHFRILPWLIELFAKVFGKWMRLSGAESLCVASNLFVGVESALTIKPYLERMTRSELCAILTNMMGNTASSVMAVYVLILIATFPHIAGHLVSATILSAPAGLVMAKLIWPETGKPETLGVQVKAYYDSGAGALESVIQGATDGGKMVFGVATLLIAVIGLAALVNLILPVGGNLINALFGIHLNWTLQGLLGYLFYPLALLVGVAPADAVEVGRLLGSRAIVTEAMAYQDLAKLMAEGALTDPRSSALAAYALCGFTHVASLGIFIGGIAAIAPSRIKDLAAVGLRAFIAATLTTLMVAAAAGVFMTGGETLIGK
ncbi:MAG: nucleoside transporter C-terminal domain-containing protein [Calditrichota bacterium]